MANLFCVKDKVVIITGGAGILGRGIAGHLAEEGAKIVILDRAAEVGEQIVADIKAKGGEASFFLTDVLNKEILEQNKKDILAKYGRIDALLNAAGGNMAGATIGPDSTIFDLNIDAFRKVVDLNLFGTVLPTMVFADVMANQREGAIVNFSSESALRPLTRVVGYGAAKAAISNLTKYLAGELAIKFGEGLRVNAIAPGFFLTEHEPYFDLFTLIFIFVCFGFSACRSIQFHPIRRMSPCQPIVFTHSVKSLYLLLIQHLGTSQHHRLIKEPCIKLQGFHFVIRAKKAVAIGQCSMIF